MIGVKASANAGHISSQHACCTKHRLYKSRQHLFPTLPNYYHSRTF